MWYTVDLRKLQGVSFPMLQTKKSAEHVSSQNGHWKEFPFLPSPHSSFPNLGSFAFLRVNLEFNMKRWKNK